MGKTTLLRAIEKDLVDGKDVYAASGTLLIPIYIDGLALPRPLRDSMLWGEIYCQTSLALGHSSRPPNHEIDFRDFLSNCSTILAESESVPRVIVLLDEIEHVVANEWAGAFFANWRSLITNHPSLSPCFCAVFSGARELEALQHDIGSPLMDVLEWRSLRSLDYEEAAELIRVPSRIAAQDDVVRRIFDETGGHPMITQYVMQRAIASAATLGMQEASAAVADFERKRHWQFADWWNKYCSSTARQIYVNLPFDGSWKPVSKIAGEFGGYESDKALEILQHVGIAEVDAEGANVRRRGSMFSRWQRIVGNVGDAAAPDEEISRLLSSLGPSFRDKYVSAWRIYSAPMPNYSGAVSEMRDTITLVLHRLAPDADVEAQPSFKFENDLTKPTRRQRVLYILGARAKEQAKSVASDDELLDTLASQVAVAVAASYAQASALTHTTAPRPLAFRALKQGESILAQILSRQDGLES
jgi:hypothetical protein